MSQYKGRRVRKKFPGYKKPFEGTVADYDSDEVLWSIKYEDGDGEDVEEHELFEIILEEAPEEDVPDDAGKAAAKKGKKKLLQLQRTRGENAQALAGSSGAAAQGKRNLHSPAETAAERHAKKQKQDGKKRADALGDQDAAAAAPEPGQLAKHNSDGKEAARTLTLMSGRSGQAPPDTATSAGFGYPGAIQGAAAGRKRAAKTRSLQTLSAGEAPKESAVQSAPAGQGTAPPRGRPRKDKAPQQQQKSLSLKGLQQKDEGNADEEGNAAEEFFIPLEEGIENEVEAEEYDGKGEPEAAREETSTADRVRRGVGNKAAASGSAATDKRRKAKESALPKTAEAVDKEEAGRGAGASELEVTGIKRGAPTSGPLAGPTRFHNHVIYGRTGYIAGQTAMDPSVQDYRIQTQQVLQQLDKQLKAAGTSKNHLLKATVLLKDIALGADVFNAVWEKWINPQHAPARTTFEASLIHPELLVEVDAIAALPANLDILE